MNYSQSISQHSKSSSRPLNLLYKFKAFLFSLSIVWHKAISKWQLWLIFSVLSSQLSSLIVWYEVISRVERYVNFSLLYFCESCTKTSQSIMLFQFLLTSLFLWVQRHLKVCYLFLLASLLSYSQGSLRYWIISGFLSLSQSVILF